MNVDGAALIASFVIGTVGLALFVYGKKQQRFPQLICGLVFMVYPYFIPDALVSSLIAVAMGGLLWFGVKRGM